MATETSAAYGVKDGTHAESRPSGARGRRLTDAYPTRDARPQAARISGQYQQRWGIECHGQSSHGRASLPVTGILAALLKKNGYATG